MATGMKPRGKRKIPPSSWKWAPVQDTAFEILKDRLTSAPVLGYPNVSTPFELHTDTSLKGLEAVLYQEQDGAKRVIAYASRGLSKSERNYPAHKLEFLALKWAIIEQFSDYLTGQTFAVYTDNNPMTYFLTSAKLDATGQRWITALSAYNFTITYKQGKTNTDADILSRYPRTETLDTDAIRAFIDVYDKQPYIESLSTVPSVCLRTQSSTNVCQNFDILTIQNKDDIISTLKTLLLEGKSPRKNIARSETETILHQNFTKLRLVNDVLVLETHKENGELRHKLKIPREKRNVILQYLHNDMGHPWRDKTVNLERERFN